MLQKFIDAHKLTGFYNNRDVNDFLIEFGKCILADLKMHLKKDIYNLEFIKLYSWIEIHNFLEYRLQQSSYDNTILIQLLWDIRKFVPRDGLKERGIVKDFYGYKVIDREDIKEFLKIKCSGNKDSDIFVSKIINRLEKLFDKYSKEVISKKKQDVDNEIRILRNTHEHREIIIWQENNQTRSRILVASFIIFCLPLIFINSKILGRILAITGAILTICIGTEIIKDRKYPVYDEAPSKKLKDDFEDYKYDEILSFIYVVKFALLTQTLTKGSDLELHFNDHIYNIDKNIINYRKMNKSVANTQIDIHKKFALLPESFKKIYLTNINKFMSDNNENSVIGTTIFFENKQVLINSRILEISNDHLGSNSFLEHELIKRFIKYVKEVECENIYTKSL
ncbi:MAG: hypothetical protein J0H68_02045 [Sphingobacteriia bacterium]|nr:hypothetical protein [Sphingobacteriia bacterium]